MLTIDYIYGMDTNDLKTLKLLQDEGRASWARLGELLGVTGPAAAERVRRLEQKGVIRGFTALIDPESVGLALTAFIAVSLEKPTHRTEFLAKVQALPEIQECHHCTGDDDYLLKVRCRGVSDLDRIINAELKSVRGVLRTRTTIVMRTSKDSPVLALPDADETS
jgi:Lrp/AsnC family transcriptional regulator, leucine-responsive regulatory protein